MAAVAAVAAVTMSVALVNFMVDGLHNRYGVLLLIGDGHFNQLHNWHLNDLLDWDGVVNVHVYNLLVGDLDDLLNGVGYGLVNLHLLDLNDRYRNVLDMGHLDGIGLGHGDLDSLGHGVWHGLRHSVGHLPQDLIGFFTDAVLSGSTVAVSKTVDLFDDGSLQAWGWGFTTRNCQTGAAQSRTTVKDGSTESRATSDGRSTESRTTTDAGASDQRATAVSGTADSGATKSRATETVSMISRKRRVQDATTVRVATVVQSRSRVGSRG